MFQTPAAMRAGERRRSVAQRYVIGTRSGARKTLCARRGNFETQRSARTGEEGAIEEQARQSPSVTLIALAGKKCGGKCISGASARVARCYPNFFWLRFAFL